MYVKEGKILPGRQRLNYCIRIRAARGQDRYCEPRSIGGAKVDDVIPDLLDNRNCSSMHLP